MTLDLDRYRINVNYVKSYFILNPNTPISKAIGEIAINTGCHIVVICYYIEELFGRSEELEQNKKRLEEFYHIDEVINKNAQRSSDE